MSRVSGSISQVGTQGSDHPINGRAGEAPCQDEPIGAQLALCRAITQLVRNGQPQIGQLDVLFALERQAQRVTSLLLTQYVAGDGRLRSFEWKTWNSALRLSQSLFRAYEYFLDHIRRTTEPNWAKHEQWVLIQLFQHRKVELMLRFMRYKKRSTEQWKQLHELYRYADERTSRKLGDATGEAIDNSRTAGRLERQYLQILLLEAMNCGRFSPRDGLWAYSWFTRWCNGPALRLDRVNGSIAREGFVVDLEGSDGLKRSPVSGNDLLWFDSSPLCAMIDQEMALLRGGATVPLLATPAVRVGQLALLHKLAILFAPHPVQVERRAERLPVTLAVQAIAGFPSIVEELRKNAQTQADGINAATAPEGESHGATLGGPSHSSRFAADAAPESFSVAGPFDTIPQIWQVKDRSDSGCRMRAQIDNLNRVIPGSLIAVRESETDPWIVSVVRWFRRLMVDHVEIGVEYLGRGPRFVKMVADSSGDLAVDELADSTSKCFAALYLPPSNEHPTMPIKTLLLPAGEFRTGCDVTLLSSTATYTMRLNEPLQQQFEFVWTSFRAVDTPTHQPHLADMGTAS
jgi:hypothetical protein